MNKRPSEIIKEKILRNGGRVIVHSITGKPYEIRHCSKGKSFLCDQLPIKPRVFALAHCGAMGTLNRNNKKSTDLKNQLADWRKIRAYLD